MCKKATGCIWQLLTMGQKAAKLPNYCILHWRLNALIRWGTCSVMLSPMITSCFLLGKTLINAESTPSPFEAGVLPLLLILLG